MKGLSYTSNIMLYSSTTTRKYVYHLLVEGGNQSKPLLDFRYCNWLIYFPYYLMSGFDMDEVQCLLQCTGMHWNQVHQMMCDMLLSAKVQLAYAVAVEFHTVPENLKMQNIDGANSWKHIKGVTVKLSKRFASYLGSKGKMHHRTLPSPWDNICCCEVECVVVISGVVSCRSCIAENVGFAIGTDVFLPTGGVVVIISPLVRVRRKVSRFFFCAVTGNVFWNHDSIRPDSFSISQA